jgi:hypothetical protein
LQSVFEKRISIAGYDDEKTTEEEFDEKVIKEELGDVNIKKN